MMDIAGTLRRWKWVLVLAAVVILAGVLVFYAKQAKKEFSLGIMIPEQIDFSFSEKGAFAMSTRTLNKHDYEKITLFLLNRDLFQNYIQETSGGAQKDPDRRFDQRGLIIPQFAVDFNSAAARNDTLQYLLFRSAPAQGITVERLGDFTLNVLKNYYLLKIFNEYFNELQAVIIKYLDSQRQILDGNERISRKIAKLREQQKKNAASPTPRDHFILQVSAENERYLELGQQLMANEILWNENIIALELIRKRIVRTRFVIGIVADLRREYLEPIYRDPRRVKAELEALQRKHQDPELDQEFKKLVAFFDLVDSHFMLYRGDPSILKARYLVFKAMAIFVFAFGMVLLAVLVFEFRRKPGR